MLSCAVTELVGALAVAAHAVDAAPALDTANDVPLVMRLESATPDSWLFAALLGAGALAQFAGLRARRRSMAVLGAVAVCCAGLLDSDPVLVVGQIALAAGLLPLVPKAVLQKSGHGAELANGQSSAQGVGDYSSRGSQRRG